MESAVVIQSLGQRCISVELSRMPQGFSSFVRSRLPNSFTTTVLLWTRKLRFTAASASAIFS